MPFDALPLDVLPVGMPFGFVREITFKERRKNAAALWQTIPSTAFSLHQWECQTTACAIGWLALLNHDGWELRDRIPVHDQYGEEFDGVTAYFGLSRLAAKRCFMGYRDCAELHGRKYASQITPSDIGRTLLTLPYSF